MGFSVKSTRRAAPVRMVIYGTGGEGKSTFASSAPNPIFIAAESGLENIDAAAVEPYPTTWAEILEALDYVGTLDHETLVVDSLDWIEPLCWAAVCEKGGKRILGKKGDAEMFGGARVEHIEAFGYGKGYNAAVDEWRLFLHRLDKLRAKGMNVILIAHSQRKMFKNPEGDDYEQWTLKLNDKATGLIVEWVDVVGFLRDDVATDDSGARVKANSTGKRILRTHPSPAALAKTRYDLPRRLVIPKQSGWNVFADALRGGDRATILSLKEHVEARIRELRDNEVEEKVRKFLKDSGETAATLTEAVERLDITIGARKAS